MAEHQHRPQWQLPTGVSRGLWDYTQSTVVAEDYDDFFAYTSLFSLDEQVILDELEQNGQLEDLIADLGCGTGRALKKLCTAGYRGLAVDFSWPMLKVIKQKIKKADLPIHCVRANLVELDALAINSVDHCICLFSTLGMIQGRENRRQALQHMARITRSGGSCVIHIHNVWFNFYDPGGPWWLLKNIVRSCFSRNLELGDKTFEYRGVPNMFLHVFRWREIKKDLRLAGFKIKKVIPLHSTRQHELKHRWWVPNLRANGWVIVARKHA